MQIRHEWKQNVVIFYLEGAVEAVHLEEKLKTVTKSLQGHIILELQQIEYVDSELLPLLLLLAKSAKSLNHMLLLVSPPPAMETDLLQAGLSHLFNITPTLDAAFAFLL